MKKSKPSIFRVFLVSYLIIALLPMLCFGLLYYQDFMNNVMDVMVEDAQNSTQNALNSLDQHLSILESIPHQIYNSSAVREYHLKGDTLSRRTIIEELKTLAAANTLIKNIWVYFREYETFISAYSNSWDKDGMRSDGAQRGFVYKNMSYDALFDLLENTRGRTVLPVSPVVFASESHNSVDIISFLQTLPADNRFAYATVLVMIDAAALSELISSAPEESYVLMDDLGKVILYAGIRSTYDVKQLTETFSEQSGAYQYTLDGEKRIVAFDNSANKGWKLLRIVSTGEMEARMWEVRVRLLAMLGMVALLSTVMILCFMRRTYRPVNNLVTLADSVLTEKKIEIGTSFNAIENALCYLQVENTQLSTVVKNQNPMIVEHNVRIMLSTPAEQWDQSVYSDAKKTGLDLDRGAYQIIILRYDDLYNVNNALNVIIESCNGLYVSSFAESGKAQILLVLGGDKEDSELFDRIDAQKLSALNIAVGQEVYAVQQWNASYIQAALAYDYMRLHRTERCVFRWSEVPEVNYVSENYPWALMQAFSAAVSQDNTRMVRLLSTQIIDFLKTDALSLTNEPQNVFCQAASCFLDTFQGKREQIEHYIHSAYRTVDGMDVNEMCTALEEMVSEFLCQKGNQQKSNENSAIYRSLGYIQNEIGQEQLSLALVSEMAGLSPSRYSTLFQQEMDCSFKEYVDTLRMKKAMKLLMETDLLIADIAQQVGYSNAYSFSRLFKRKVGLTPQLYRQSKE